MSSWVQALRITGLGWFVAICVVLGVLGGLWLDRHFGSTPVLTLVGTVLGAILAFYGIYRATRRFLKD